MNSPVVACCGVTSSDEVNRLIGGVTGHVTQRRAWRKRAEARYVYFQLSVTGPVLLLLPRNLISLSCSHLTLNFNFNLLPTFKMSIFVQDPETRRIMEEAELREQRQNYRHNTAVMNLWDPLPPYRPRSPSPPTMAKLHQEIDDIAPDDPEMLQRLKDIARKLPIPLMSAADKENAAKERKLLDRQIEDRRLADRETRARWLESLHESPTVFGLPRDPRDPAPQYCADVAKEKAAVRRKRLEEDEEEAKAKKQLEAQRLHESFAGSRHYFFGDPCRSENLVPEDNENARMQGDESMGKGKRKRTDEPAIETAPLESTHLEDHTSSSRKRTRTGDLTGDSSLEADVSSQSDTATAENEVDVSISPALSPQSSTSSPGGTKPSVDDSEPEVSPDGHVENGTRVGSPATIPSTASSQQEDHVEKADTQPEGEPSADNNSDY